MRTISIDDTVADVLLSGSAAVAAGVSGGKDSCLLGFELDAYLNKVKYTGPRILIHSDLGFVEWEDSLPTCERLAKAIGWELVVVKRKAGGMMERWEKRWSNNLERYRSLSCVKLILPWSTAMMRFCTSELKVDVICAYLVKRFPSTTILSVTGIRRDESDNREKAPISKRQSKLVRDRQKTVGYNWNPVLDWTLPEVFCRLSELNFPIHEAYTKYGSSRVSCAFCILGSQADLLASSKCERNQNIYRRMVALEATSTFSFQNGWLGDVAPHLLSEGLRDGLALAKKAAKLRAEAEALIPKHLLYTKGWPTCVPAQAEAVLLADVRNRVADAVGITLSRGVTPADVILRYEELLAEKAKKSAA